MTRSKGISARCANACAACMLLTMMAGCPALSPVDADGYAEPDVATIAMVVKHVYGLQGRGRIIFLGADEDAVQSEALTQAGAVVEADLGVRVLPESAADRSDLSLPAFTPVDPETGEIGVSINVGRFRLTDDGKLEVSAGAVLSGVSGQGYDFVLEQVGESWTIVSMTESWVA
jgi:hypothetical protein